MLNRLFSIQQVAELLGSSPKGVCHWIEKGWLASKEMADGTVRISERGLIEFLRSRGVDIEELMAKVAKQETKAPSPSRPLVPPPADSEKRTPAGAAAPVADEPPVAPAASAADSAAGPAQVRALGDPAAQVAEAILRDAVSRHASHIHMDCCAEGLSLRMRIDGVMHERANFKARLPKTLAPKLIRRFKDLAGLEAAPRVQQGHFRSTLEGRELRFCVSACPTASGEKLVVAVLEDGAVGPDLGQLGLSEEAHALVRGALCRPCGLILLAGPPRSGKTTTLEAMLAELKGSGRERVALEGPQALRLDGGARCPVAQVGLTFAEGLSAFCRQDADVIAVADVTDPAVDVTSAALEGRLVIGSILAGSTAAALEILLEGSARWAVAAALLAVVDQRAVRRLCPMCKQPADPPSALLARLKLDSGEVDFPVYRGTGCKRCAHAGYAGRTGVFSVLPVDEVVARMLRQGQEAEEIWRAAVRAGTQTLQRAGLAKVRAGITSLEELARVLPTGR